MWSRAVATLQVVGLGLLALSVLAQLVAASSADVLPGGFLSGLSVPVLMAVVTLSTFKGRVRRVAFGLACGYIALSLVYLALIGWVGGAL